MKKTKKFKENCPENSHVHDTTLHTIEVFAKSSHWTSPNTGMITMRGK